MKLIGLKLLKGIKNEYSRAFIGVVQLESRAIAHWKTSPSILKLKAICYKV